MFRHISKGKNFSLGIFFVLGFACIILFSFIWKIGIAFSQSEIDTKHQFILAIFTQEKEPQLALFTPDVGTLTVISVQGGNSKDVVGLEHILGVPIDGFVRTKGAKDINTLLHTIPFIPKQDTNLSTIDTYKLWFLSFAVPKNAVTFQTINSKQDEIVLAKEEQKIFIDKMIYQEGKTVAIVNATGVAGIGARLARVLTNVGVNVILVRTADSVKQTSTMEFTGQVSYTITKIKKIIAVNPVRSNISTMLTDITIIIGKDSLKNFIF
jgi:hypothetical protein